MRKPARPRNQLLSEKTPCINHLLLLSTNSLDINISSHTSPISTKFAYMDYHPPWILPFQMNNTLDGYCPVWKPLKVLLLLIEFSKYVIDKDRTFLGEKNSPWITSKGKSEPKTKHRWTKRWIDRGHRFLQGDESTEPLICEFSSRGIYIYIYILYIKCIILNSIILYYI